jgi:hypothetical protein
VIVLGLDAVTAAKKDTIERPPRRDADHPVCILPGHCPNPEVAPFRVTAAQDGDFVAQHEELDVLRSV